jgi:hypothetical protein
LIIDEDKGVRKFVYMWNNGSTIKDAINKDKLLLKIMSSYDSFITNCYKNILDYFGDNNYGNVYDFPIQNDLDEKSLIAEYIKNKNDFGQEWQILRAQASVVYHNIEKRGIINEYKLVYPKYSLDVFTGRSKTTDVIVQGFDSSYNIKHPNESYNLLIHFDWISADFRIAALMSEDDNLLDSFKKGDPYSYIEDQLGDEVDRGECKLTLLQSTYSLDYDSEIFAIYPTFRKWMMFQSHSLKSNGFSKSILGRKFYYDGSFKSEKRCINAIMQGSVAHAMNSVMHETYNKCGNIILTEQHDSLTVCTNSAMAAFVIESISKVMYRPFKSIDATMPFKISIGNRWNNYKYLKECR